MAVARNRPGDSTPGDQFLKLIRDIFAHPMNGEFRDTCHDALERFLKKVECGKAEQIVGASERAHAAKELLELLLIEFSSERQNRDSTQRCGGNKSSCNRCVREVCSAFKAEEKIVSTVNQLADLPLTIALLVKRFAYVARAERRRQSKRKKRETTRDKPDEAHNQAKPPWSKKLKQKFAGLSWDVCQPKKSVKNSADVEIIAMVEQMSRAGYKPAEIRRRIKEQFKQRVTIKWLKERLERLE